MYKIYKIVTITTAVLLCCILLIYLLMKNSSTQVHPSNLNQTHLEHRSLHKEQDDNFSNTSNVMPIMDDKIMNEFEGHPNYGLFNSYNCGIIYSGKKVVRGKITNIMENPWMVALVFHNEKTNSTSIDCGGTLISENLVLTAAHCFPNKRKLVSVRLGEYNLTTNPDCSDFHGETICAEKVQEITDFKILKHEFYVPGFYDIALVKLNEPAKLEQKSINTICLPFKHKEEDEHENYYITGWGRMSNDDKTFPDVLLGGFVPFLNSKNCSGMIQRVITKKHMCAGIAGSTDSCNGDSGGPLSHLKAYDGRVKSYQFGIVSYAPNDECGTTPAVYTKVYAYLDWILKNANF